MPAVVKETLCESFKGIAGAVLVELDTAEDVLESVT